MDRDSYAFILKFNHLDTRAPREGGGGIFKFAKSDKDPKTETVGRDRGELRRNTGEIEENLEDMHKLKLKVCAVVDVLERETKVRLITEAIDRLGNDLKLLREKQSAATSFRARAKWYDQGEKSNKYFTFQTNV